MLCIAGAYANPPAQPGPNLLPFLGSRAAIEQYWQDHITHFSIRLVKTNGVFSTQSYAYSPALGELRAIMTEKFATQLDSFVSAADAGATIEPSLGFRWSLPPIGGVGSRSTSILCPKSPFVVSMDGNGHAITPSNVVTWPLNQWLVVTNPSPSVSGIKQVEYRMWDQYGNPLGDPIFTTNGSASILADEQDALVIPVGLIDADSFRELGWGAQLIFHYDGGVTDTYDILTGQKINSTFVLLRMSAVGNDKLPLVFVESSPGNVVSLETSDDLVHWKYEGKRAIKQTAKGMFLFPSTSTLYVRGRIGGDVAQNAPVPPGPITLEPPRFLEGMPLLYIHGGANQEVAIESSSNLLTWEYEGTRVLGTDGAGMFIFPPADQLFIRARSP